MRAVPLVLLLALGCREPLVPDRPPPATDPSAAWAALLRRAVDPHGYVHYDLLERERDTLEDYVAWLGGPTPWERHRVGRRLALYLDAWNALVLYQVLERGRPDSVLDVRGWLPGPGSGFFVETRFRLGREWRSLSEIAHQLVRHAELDVRAHAALSCAAMSCPPVRPELYTRGGNLLAKLEDQMRRWLADDERGVRIEGDVAVFNPIFDRYARDFSAWTAGADPCTLAAGFTSGEKQARLLDLAAQGCPRRFFPFDARLNDAARAPGRGSAPGGP